MTAPAKQALRAAGYFSISVVTGLMVYKTPPDSLQQLFEWAWQPGLQGLSAALLSLGLNRVTPGRRPAPPPPDGTP